jgi:hypothetical protein
LKIKRIKTLAWIIEAKRGHATSLSIGTSKYMKVPHFLRNVFRCLMTTAGITFFLSSGLPYPSKIIFRIQQPTNVRKEHPQMASTAVSTKIVAKFISVNIDNPSEISLLNSLRNKKM